MRRASLSLLCELISDGRPEGPGSALRRMSSARDYRRSVPVSVRAVRLDADVLILRCL